MQIRVYYEDTDCGGIVYHANYLKFCERARSEKFFSQNQSPEYGGYSFVVRSIEADYLAPAKLGELLEVKTQIEAIKNASLILQQSIERNGKLLFQMKVTLVCVKDQKAIKIPEEIKASL